LAFGVWVERVEQAVAPKVLVDATYRALQHLTDFARLQMSERLPRELCPLLVEGAVEKHHVQVRVLATSVPPPRFHTVKYAGVLAPAASSFRACIKPQPIRRANDFAERLLRRNAFLNGCSEELARKLRTVKVLGHWPSAQGRDVFTTARGGCAQRNFSEVGRGARTH
jgi:hypothetical protein